MSASVGSSGGSDSEEFYDAEDVTPNRGPRKHRDKEEVKAVAAVTSETSQELGQDSVPDAKPSSLSGKVSQEHLLEIPVVKVELHDGEAVSEVVQAEEAAGERGGSDGDDKCQSQSEGKLAELEKRKRRMEELRRRMQTEEEEGALPSPPDSQTSSVDGVFAASRPSHPFRIVEHDALSLQSTISLGRVGRILGGVDGSTGGSSRLHSDPGCSTSMAMKEDKISKATDTVPIGGEAEQPKAICTTETKSLAEEDEEEEDTGDVIQEPDVVASTKAKGLEAPGDLKVPVAPPRRKRKAKGKTTGQVVSEVKEADDSAPELPSPASTIESLAREFEHSLDIRLATKGQYVVKPQDEDKTKAEGCSTAAVEAEKASEESQPSSSQEPSPSPSSSQSGSLGLAPVTLLNNQPESSSKKASPSGSANRLTVQSLAQSMTQEDMMQAFNMVVRTRTDSGKELTDLVFGELKKALRRGGFQTDDDVDEGLRIWFQEQPKDFYKQAFEILEQVTVLNLDTGERVPLSIAEDKLPKCINPLSLHIMRLTSEYISNSSLDKEKESDEESVDLKKVATNTTETDGNGVKKKTSQLKRFLGVTMKKTMDKAKSIAQEVSHARHKDEGLDIADDNPGTEHYLKVKASSSHKGPYEFDTLQFIQDLSGEHSSPIWCMKFSACGRLLATAGQDRLLRIWVLRDAYTYFQDMRTKYNAEKVSPTPSQESLVSQQSTDDALLMAHAAAAAAAGGSAEQDGGEQDAIAPFMPKPFCIYSGHTSDLLDVSWSKNYFILSSSMDKTVRLWHISRKECLCCFQHIDFVTAIAFHPRDDRYFLSGSLDGKLRLWNIPDKKVALWNELDGQSKLITAANFCQNGKFAVVGSYDGRCLFYNTDQLKYHTQIHVRSTRGKNAKGRKISGIEPMPGEDKVLVTSNDSRIRLYDLRDLNLSCKYKGCSNVSSQIRASFSHDGKYIISGSENQCIYIWRTHHDYAKFSSARRDRNDYWEGIKAHNALVTCAVFAPNPDLVIKQVERERQKTEDPLLPPQTSGCSGYVIVSADFNGCIKVFLNKVKPKHSSLPASAMA